MLAASLNAFFCASPIYGSAEDFTFLLNFTPCEGLTPAAKQQIGETRKMCNSDDRRLRRIQGGAVGAAASRMRAAAKQTLGAATRLSAATSFFPFRQLLRDYQGRAAPSSCLPRLESSGCFSGSLLARKRELSPAKKRSTPAPLARQPFLVLFWCAKENLTPRNSALLYYTPTPPDFYDQFPKASIFRPSATLQGRASVLYFL